MILKESEIQNDIKDQLDVIRNIVSSIESKSSNHTVSNRIATATPLEFLYVYTHLISKKQNSSPLRKLFIDFFQSLETAFPTGAFVGAKMLTDTNSYEWTGPLQLGANDLISKIRNIVGHEAFNVVKQIIKCGGLYKSVLWDSQVDEGYTVEVDESRLSLLRLAESFSKSINSLSTVEKAIFLISDSVFEKMSEIDSLIRGSIKDEIPVILVARGFLPDVSFTLSHNYMLDKLKVIPCVIESNDHDPFEMSDIAKIVGSDVIPGPISVYTWNEIKDLGKEVFDCRISKETVSINTDLRENIDELVSQILNDDREEVSNQQRIKRVLGNSIQVKFPANSNDISKSRIKKGLYLYRQWARSGICESDFLEFPATINLINKAADSAESLRSKLFNIKFYIRTEDGLEKELAVSR